MARERARASRRTSARHSSLTAAGRGDPRDHRRENQRLTESDLDLEFLEINRDAKLTLVLDGIAKALPAPTITLGAGLAYDSAGRLALNLVETSALTDSTAGTPSVTATLDAIPDPADAPATADILRDDLVANALPAIRNALATIAAAINSILAEAATAVRVP